MLLTKRSQHLHIGWNSGSSSSPGGGSTIASTGAAMGQTFGAIESTPKIWDIAAAWLLLEELNCSIEWLETNPLNLVSGEDLSDVNFPLIACRSIEKFEILKPWGNLLLEK